MAEYLYNEIQSVALNSPVLFRNSIPCQQGFVYHEGETGNFILRNLQNWALCIKITRYSVNLTNIYINITQL